MSVELGLDEYSIIEKLNGVVEILKNSVVSFDIDGVEINSAVSAIKKLNKIFNTNYTVKDLTNYWSMVDLIKKADSTIEDPRAYAINLWNSEDVFKNAPPASGAWLLADYLRGSQVNVHRITSRPSHVAEVTLGWYAERMPWVDQKLIHIQENSPSLRDKSQLALHKIEIINRLGVQYHFEDSFEEAEAIVANTSAKVILVPASWNSDYNNPKPGIIIPSLRFNRDIPTLVSVFLDLYDRIR